MKKTARRNALKPRKIPRQSRSGETVAVILEAAARILEARGLAGYTTNAVAKRAGVSIGSLYQYFPNKDAITVALIARETAPLAEAARAAAAMPWREGLSAILQAAVRHQMQRPELARLLDFEEARLPMRPDSTRATDAMETAIAVLLTCGKIGNSRERSLLTADLVAMVRGLIDAAGMRGETNAAALEKRVSRAVFGYLGLTPGSQTGR